MSLQIGYSADIEVREIFLKTDSQAGITVLYVSYLHLNRFGAGLVQKIIAIIEAYKPDLLLLGGDYLDTRSGLPHLEFLLRAIKGGIAMMAIAGNHDFFFEHAESDLIKSLIPDNVIYLNDSGISIDGLNIWGSPVTPWFFDWAFNRHRGDAIKTHWDLIPQNTDILITHGPVYGILDRTIDGKRVGCEALKDAVDVIKPKVQICGHIHEGYGQIHTSITLYINGSVLDVRYRLVNLPIVFEI